MGRLLQAGGIDLLIGAGEVETGIADALWPDADGEDSLGNAARRASVAAADAYLSGDQEPARRALTALRDAPLPRRIESGTPEGFAWYGLYPESYVEAAQQFANEHHPAAAVVLGIRNIGTTLSAIVVAALKRLGCVVETWTVRPHGHPFDRRLRLSAGLERRLTSTTPGTWFAVVDEGPGLSGSSFASVARKLGELGAPDERIVLFPSWDCDGSRFVSAAAREQWQRHRRYPAGFAPPATGLADLSAGAWRRLSYADASAWPAVQPQHERRKYLEGGGVLWKFEGLGRFGEAKLDRARRLHAAGFTPRPLGLQNGFLRMDYLPLLQRVASSRERNLLDRISAYICYLRDAFPGGEGAGFDQLAQMIRVNTGIDGVESWRTPFEDAPVCAIDGRMLPHEWIETAGGCLKTDALDHHDDHFLPGCQSPAWDVAGASIEFGLEPAAEEALAARCGVSALLPFYKLAYAAFRTGYATLAQTAVAGTPEADRFATAIRRYRSAAESAIPSLRAGKSLRMPD